MMAEGERRTSATFYGVPVESDRIIFVIDVSASMLRRDPGEDGSRFQVAVRELLGAARKLEAEARINVIFFGTEVWKWEKSLQKLNAATLARLERDLRTRRPIGATYLYDGLEAALDDPEVETIYLLSDGAPSGGEVRRARGHPAGGAATQPDPARPHPLHRHRGRLRTASFPRQRPGGPVREAVR